MHEQLTEWWNGISLRGKITGVTVMLLTLGLLVAGVGTMSFLRSYLLNQVYTSDLNVYALAPGPIRELDLWLAPYRRLWNESLDALERHLDEEEPA